MTQGLLSHSCSQGERGSFLKGETKPQGKQMLGSGPHQGRPPIPIALNAWRGLAFWGLCLPGLYVLPSVASPLHELGFFLCVKFDLELSGSHMKCPPVTGSFM